MLSDKIDINNESEHVIKQRENNNKKNESTDHVKKDRKGFCTSCLIF
jgi:hypothetical protein